MTTPPVVSNTSAIIAPALRERVLVDAGEVP
jgi:hypothetical protein